MAQQPPARKQPIGRPLKWTPSQLDALATISQADIEAAKAHWRNAASPAYADLLDADTHEGGG